jgi:hypothetical protein
VDTGGLQLSVRFPVERDDATNVDQKITHSVLVLLSENTLGKGCCAGSTGDQSCRQGLK